MVSRGTALAVTILLAAGCGPTRVMLIERGRTAEYTQGVLPESFQPIDLVACLVPDNYNSLKSGRRYAVGHARQLYVEGAFTDVRENFEGLEDVCDLKLRVHTNNLNHLEVFAAKTGRRLFDVKSNAGGAYSPLFRSALYRRFADNPNLVAQLRAERMPRVGDRHAENAQVMRTSAPPFPSDSARGDPSPIDIPAYQHAERPRDFAVVVGVEKYQDLPPADFAERDAQAVKNHLKALGVPERNIAFLVDSRALRSSLEKYIEQWLPNLATQDSRVYFYFSGHGAPDIKTGDSFLVTWEGDASYLATTAYPLKRLYEKLSGLKAKEIVVVLDACFSGAGGRSVLAKGARPLVMKVTTATVPQNLTVFSAASGEQITSTLEDQDHGTFTYYFLKGLSGAAKDASGAVTAKGLYDYLKPKVQDAARRQNRDQEPVLHGPGDRALVRF